MENMGKRDGWYSKGQREKGLKPPLWIKFSLAQNTEVSDGVG